jgi:hypothetical protein
MVDDVENTLTEAERRLIEGFHELGQSLMHQAPPESLMLSFKLGADISRCLMDEVVNNKIQECKNAIGHLKNQIQRNIEMIEVLENGNTNRQATI